MKTLIYASLLFCVVSNTLRADPPQPPPRTHFEYVGEMYAEAGFPGDTKTDHDVVLPDIGTIDISWHQSAGTEFSGGGAQGSISMSELPNGIYVECSGGQSGQQRWAVLKPYSGGDIVRADADPHTLQPGKTFLRLGIYCDAGTGGAFQGGNNTHVKVWVLEKGAPKVR